MGEMAQEVIVRVEAEVNPTEDEEKVRQAIGNVVGGAEFTLEPAFKGSVLKAEARGQESLTKFRNMLRNDRIRDASRKLLYRAMVGDKISFYLNKQVAFAGHVSFSEESGESPLGPLRVTIQTSSPMQLIDWLAEKTERK